MRDRRWAWFPLAVLLSMTAPGAAGAAAPAAPTESPARERRLHVAAAEASSFLVNDWNRFQENYLPQYVGDDDPRTAWSLKTEGIGEWVRVRVTPMERATRVRMKIRNGYQKSEKLFQANSRAKEITVVLLPSNKTADVTLTDASGWQEIAVEQPSGPLNAVELRIKSVYAGKKYDDLCISDVQLFVTAGSSDNPAFEKQHFEKLVTWKKERVAAAKMFRSELGKALPLAAQYVSARKEGQMTEQAYSARIKACTAERANRDLCWMRFGLEEAIRANSGGNSATTMRTALELAKSKFASMTAVRVSSRDPRPVPAVDGVCVPQLDGCSENPCYEALPLPMPAKLGYLQRDALALVEQTGLPTVAEVDELKPPQCHQRGGTTFAWALRERDAGGAPSDAPGAIRALLLARCGLVEGREGSYPASRVQLLVYGEAGRLEVIADQDHAAALDWGSGTAGPRIAKGHAWTPSADVITIEAAELVAAQ